MQQDRVPIMPMSAESPKLIDLAREAKAACTRLYEALEAVVKRFPPDQFGPSMIKLMRHYQDIKKFAFGPPHRVAMAIEANCAYAREYHRDLFTKESYRKVMNVLHREEDPAMLHLAGSDFTLFMLSMYREQLELQAEWSKLELARYYRLYVKDNPLPNIATEFFERFGLSIEEWAKASMVLFSMSVSRPNGQIFLNSPIAVDGVRVKPDSVEFYLRQACFTPQEVGSRFRRLRAEIGADSHALIRSSFLERPLIRFDAQRVFAPFPALVFQFTEWGLYRLIHDLPSFAKDFGRAVQSYVGELVQFLPGVRRVLTDLELEAHSPQKSCDFLLEFGSYVLLVEAKAAFFSRNFLTKEKILDDNSTHKTAKALEQLYVTAYDLQKGLFQSLGIDSRKPVYGIVATFGHIPFANAPWYYETFLLAAAESKLKPPIYPNPSFGIDRLCWRSKIWKCLLA
jgi:hypothetical protein